MKTRLTLLLVFFLVGIFSALTRTALGVTSQSDAPQSCTTDVCGQATRSRCGATCPGASCRCQGCGPVCERPVCECTCPSGQVIWTCDSGDACDPSDPPKGCGVCRGRCSP